MTRGLFDGGPAGQGVYVDLRARIIRLELPPGTSLLRAELASTYGVSLTPVRDALQQLAKEGLVAIYPQSRTLVTPIDIDAIHEAQFMRISLESEVVRELAHGIASPEIEKLYHLVDQQERIMFEPMQINRFQELDEAFHQALFAAAGHGETQALMRRHAGQLDRLRRLDLPEALDASADVNTEAVTEGHRAILSGIVAGDRARAVDALRQHLQRTVNRIAEKRLAFPKYFSPETR